MNGEELFLVQFSLIVLHKDAEISVLHAVASNSCTAMQQKYWCNQLCNHNAFMHHLIYHEKHLQRIWLC